MLPTTAQGDAGEAKGKWWPFSQGAAGPPPVPPVPPLPAAQQRALRQLQQRPQNGSPPRKPLKSVAQATSFAPAPLPPPRAAAPRLQRPPAAKPTPFLPVPAAPVESVYVFKPKGASLGVKFYGDDAKPGTKGAEVVSVEDFGIAYRAGIKMGDRVHLVRAFSSVRPGEVVSEAAVSDGYSAAKALRPAVGRLELRVSRYAPDREARAAILLQAHWRRCRAMCEAHDRLDAIQEQEEWEETCERAALLIQSAFRRYDAWVRAYGRYLAVEHIQQATRVWLKHPHRRSRSPNGAATPEAPNRKARKRQHCGTAIRAPPRLDW